MKNITVTVPDVVYHRARVHAAEKKTTVSAMVKSFLTSVVEEESDFDRLKREERELRARLKADGRVFAAAENVSRDDLYDRHALR